MALVLLLGGARSGKSALAVGMLEELGIPAAFLATGAGGDEEMRERIRRHQAGRPPSWTTVEAPVDLESALSGLEATTPVLLDCLTLWVSNLLGRGETDEAVCQRAGQVAGIAASRPGPVVVVSNEVGSGIVPSDPLARRYRDLLGQTNATFAAVAAHAALVVAGRLLPLADARTFLRTVAG